jgi:hypothetical protein
VPYQLVPSAKKVRMSHLLAVVVKVGAALLGHFTLVNVPVKLPAPVLTIRMNDLPAVAVGMVNVQLPVIVTVWKVPLVKSSVFDVLELPIATTDSVYKVTVVLDTVVLPSVVVVFPRPTVVLPITI